MFKIYYNLTSSENEYDMSINFSKNGVLKMDLERFTWNPLSIDPIEIVCPVNFKECSVGEYCELTTGIERININSAMVERKKNRQCDG